MHKSRFIVGIDLGTTNIAVACCDTEAATRRVELFAVPQLIAPGELRALELLPSWCYLPDPARVVPGSLALPWTADASLAVGAYARDEGTRTPWHCIGSAKSWLCHAGVDRRAAILPWGAPAGAAKLSPLDVTRLYLEHLRAAWNRQFGSRKDADGEPCTLERQQVTITVPAGFDETARELTLAAAEAAGLRHLLLLEEPLAAFYSWLSRSDAAASLRPGEKVLVIDVGGGTSDFSLIAMDEDGVLSRTAAGEHLLLGGDNLDMAVARRIESAWNTHLNPGEWTALCGQVRTAKEQLFGSGLTEVPVTLLSSGSAVIGNARSAVLRRDELEEVAATGFFPALDRDAPDPVRRSGMRTMGLPYAADPAITRHLLAFLRYAARLAGAAAGEGTALLRPDRILFNGGAMIPEFLRRRVVGVISSWFPGEPPIPELPSRDLNLAVAYGAAAFGLSCRGEGVRVKCGTSRAYYVATAGADGPVYVCVMPRGVDENIRTVCPRDFELEANRTAEFPLYSSSTRLNDRPGDLVTTADELTPLSTLASVLRFGGGHHRRRLRCGLSCLLTETGVLNLAVESRESAHTWPLRFDVRYAIGADRDGGDTPVTIIDRGQTEAAAAMIGAAFAAGDVSGLIAGLERMLALPRKEWPLPLLRCLADALLAVPAAQLATAAIEAR
ncbi:MAG: Hsp70 family protein [Victivallales bacterium]|nr:Hsp70 family protein [Victivallales bacterium]